MRSTQRASSMVLLVVVIASSSSCLRESSAGRVCTVDGECAADEVCFSSQNEGNLCVPRHALGITPGDPTPGGPTTPCESDHITPHDVTGIENVRLIANGNDVAVVYAVERAGNSTLFLQRLDGQGAQAAAPIQLLEMPSLHTAIPSPVWLNDNGTEVLLLGVQTFDGANAEKLGYSVCRGTEPCTSLQGLSVNSAKDLTALALQGGAAFVWVEGSSSVSVGQTGCDELTCKRKTWFFDKAGAPINSQPASIATRQTGMGVSAALGSGSDVVDVLIDSGSNFDARNYAIERTELDGSGNGGAGFYVPTGPSFSQDFPIASAFFANDNSTWTFLQMVGDPGGVTVHQWHVDNANFPIDTPTSLHLGSNSLPHFVRDGTAFAVALIDTPPSTTSRSRIEFSFLDATLGTTKDVVLVGDGGPVDFALTDPVVLNDRAYVVATLDNQLWSGVVCR